MSQKSSLPQSANSVSQVLTADSPRISSELRELIRRMNRENRLWGAPRINGELLKLGFEVAESTVSKYMIHHRGPPSQSWRTFLRDHADAIAAIDLFVVHTVTFEHLFALVIIGHGRRQLLWFAVTRHGKASAICCANHSAVGCAAAQLPQASNPRRPRPAVACCDVELMSQHKNFGLQCSS
jgi:hypothetical protein